MTRYNVLPINAKLDGEQLYAVYDNVSQKTVETLLTWNEAHLLIDELPWPETLEERRRMIWEVMHGYEAETV